MKLVKEYIWYSPKLDSIRLMPIGECRERKNCRWDRCAYISFKADKIGRIRQSGAFYYIGEL